MLKRTFAVAALAGATLLAASPAFADGYRRYSPQQRVVYVQPRVAYYAHRPVFVHRPVYQRPAPAAVVYRERGSSDLLGGLIVGAVLGAVIASHAGY